MRLRKHGTRFLLAGTSDADGGKTLNSICCTDFPPRRASVSASATQPGKKRAGTRGKLLRILEEIGLFFEKRSIYNIGFGATIVFLP